MSIPTFEFGTGAPAYTPRSSQRFDGAEVMPLEQKEEFCRDLLAEWGVVNVRERRKDHELIHGCLVNPDLHSRQASEPTASLNYANLKYKCLGCGSAGSLVWLVAEINGWVIDEAVRWLKERAGIGSVLGVDDLLRYIDALYKGAEKVPPMPVYSERMLDRWNLIHPYLTDPREDGGRGIPIETVRAMRLGYAADYRVSKNDDGTWKTSERIVIPQFWNGSLVGWQTRRLDARDGTHKYLASTDFPKDTTVYNYDKTRPFALVCESAMSVLGHLHAIPEMVSTWGSMSDTQVGLLAKHSRVIQWPDADPAGWKVVTGHTDYWPSGKVRQHKPGNGEVLAQSTDYWVVQSPWAADPGDMETEDVIGHYQADAVPWTLWKPPSVLFCYRCKNRAHQGPCAAGGR